MTKRGDIRLHHYVSITNILYMFSDSSSRNNIQLAPLPDSYDLDRGLLLSVQAIQVDEALYVMPFIYAYTYSRNVPLNPVLCCLLGIVGEQRVPSHCWDR